MKKISVMTLKFLFYILFLVIGISIGLVLGNIRNLESTKNNTKTESAVKYDDTRNSDWVEEFQVVDIKSSLDTCIQKAYFYKSTSEQPVPLVVSLHTWSGDYTQVDPLAELCRTRNLNYIHPDFRGPNNTINACCSELALYDIDDAIEFAIKNSNTDVSRIYVIGASGGGYATLASFMKLKHEVKKFSAWVGISDLEAWYNESMIMKNKYYKDILACTGSDSTGLNVESARSRSPIFMKIPLHKIPESELMIYTGIYDGIQGSVPITQSINFYNKLISDLSVSDPSVYVSDAEKLKLLEFRKPLGDFGQIADRDICLQKSFSSIKLTVFTGNHEMLPEYALDELLK